MAARLESFSVQGRNTAAVTADGETLGIRCTKARCGWSSRVASDLLRKAGVQAAREGLPTLALIPEDVRTLATDYGAPSPIPGRDEAAAAFLARLESGRRSPHESRHRKFASRWTVEEFRAEIDRMAEQERAETLPMRANG